MELAKVITLPVSRKVKAKFKKVSRGETEFLTEEEAQAILRVSDRRTLQGKRDYAILLTLLSTGLRKAEICNLKIGDVRTYRNQHVLDAIGKGQKFRRVPLKTETLIAIQDYLRAKGNANESDGALFHTLEGKGLTSKAVDCIVKATAKKALINKRVHPHVMRHTFATTLLSKGVDLKTVQNLMGHAHIRTTETYLHSTDDRKVEAIQRLPFGA